MLPLSQTFLVDIYTSLNALWLIIDAVRSIGSGFIELRNQTMSLQLLIMDISASDQHEVLFKFGYNNLSGT